MIPFAHVNSMGLWSFKSIVNFMSTETWSI
jgi:hypothetical protein